MKHRVVSMTLCIVLFSLFFWRSPVFTQENPGKPKPNPIEGVWIEVSVEREGSQLLVPSITDARMASTEMHEPYVWRIAKATIEEGPDEKDRFPRWRFSYKLNPDNQKGAIDLILSDEEKRKRKEEKPKVLHGIYFVKDDYLMICIGQDSRPKRFCSSKDNPNWMYILRRSKLKFAGPDAAKPKHEDE